MTASSSPGCGRNRIHSNALPPHNGGATSPKARPTGLPTLHRPTRRSPPAFAANKLDRLRCASVDSQCLFMKVVCTILAAAFLAFVAPCARAELANGIVAIVHDSVVTFIEVDDLTRQTAPTTINTYRNQPDVLEKKLEETRNVNRQTLIEKQLILHDFKTAGYQLPESVIDDLVQERIRARFIDRVTLVKSLQAEGITVEKFRRQVRENFIVEALRAKNISSEIIISPHKVATYYQAHHDDFKVEDEVKLRMIVLTNAPQSRKMADEIHAKLKEGASFKELAAVYSQGSARHQAGDWGWVERSVLRKELADVAFSLKPGQFSNVIETGDTCYLMMVEEARISHFKPLSEVREQIERTLVLDERKRLEQQWMDKLKKKTFVRYFF